MTNTQDSGWRAIIGSSAILSLILLGDALIYAVLPVYAAEFGLSLTAVGVMLSANRFVRVFAYGLVARVTYAIGLRRICLYAALVTTATTAMYGLSDGPVLMFIARTLYGLSYAAMVLATLAYAIAFREQVGLRVGVGRTIQRLGPIAVLLCGPWLVAYVGPQMAFVYLAVPTAISILIALSLPKPTGVPEADHGTPRSIARPKPIDIIFFLLGYGIDGLFAISITLILAQDVALEAALVSGGALLAMRHVGEAVAAPLFGWIADKYGARRVFIGSGILTVAGFAFIALDLTIVGALLMLIFRGALASLGPAVIVEGLAEDQQPLGDLAQMQAWRDLGAAFGPLVTGFLIAYASPEFQHGVFAVLLAIGLLIWIRYTAPMST